MPTRSANRSQLGAEPARSASWRAGRQLVGVGPGQPEDRQVQQRQHQQLRHDPDDQADRRIGHRGRAAPDRPRRRRPWCVPPRRSPPGSRPTAGPGAARAPRSAPRSLLSQPAAPIDQRSDQDRQHRRSEDPGRHVAQPQRGAVGGRAAEYGTAGCCGGRVTPRSGRAGPTTRAGAPSVGPGP